MEFHRSNIHDLLNSEGQHPDFSEGLHGPSSCPESCSSNAKPKRARAALNKDQLKALELLFKKSPYPTIQERKDLAKTLGLSDRKVTNWFTRERRDAPRRFLPDGTKLEFRQRLTEEQLSRLEKEYALNKRPSKEEQKAIALDIDLPELKVDHWLLTPGQVSPHLHQIVGGNA
ncbi:hypothetical protein DFP72DRAFT_1123524 [Ephemerocybe angulata]|uniref:Homeobox domain-containing protein n=1 Tax=Ephemerocybe angulata TaxID=980116 RepID=A0A8H6HXT0_9AGAR|nr:hypothetical protein DFP72DRAFT_1123524 [Tulosesus angulatus]